jgi:C-terminal processing protease CtpA/Prc
VILGERDGRVVVESLLPGGPAEIGGIRPGDVIEKVGGRSVEGMSVPEAAGLCRGESESAVSLDLFRPSTGDRLSLALTRKVLSGGEPRSEAERGRGAVGGAVGPGLGESPGGE